MSVEVKPAYEPESGSWSYLVADPHRGVAAIIDPVWVYDAVSGRTSTSFIDTLLIEAQARGWRMEWVLETHAHADHLTAAAHIRAKTGAKVAIGAGICSVQENFARLFNLHDFPTDGRQFDRLLKDGDIIDLGNLQIRVMETPGHTGDSISYLVEDAAFIGDTLFEPGHGTARCDFPGGDAGRLFDSVQKIYSLPEQTRLFLCHDYPKEGATARCMVPLIESMRDNVHISNDASREAFIAMRRERDAHLGLPRLILPALQINIRAGAAPAVEANGVSYLRIPFNADMKAVIGAARNPS